MWRVRRTAIVVCAFALAATGCSSYKVKADAIHGVAPREAPEPRRIVVAVPDLADPGLAGLGPVATSTLRELHLDFIALLERSGLFAKVEQVSFASGRNPSAGPDEILAMLVHRPELPARGARLIQQVLVAASLFKLAPIVDAHETYGITAELSLVRPGDRESPRRYVGSGVATLTSKIYAPREEAVREALVAAGRAAKARVVEQLAQEGASASLSGAK